MPNTWLAIQYRKSTPLPDVREAQAVAEAVSEEDRPEAEVHPAVSNTVYQY